MNNIVHCVREAQEWLRAGERRTVVLVLRSDVDSVQITCSVEDQHGTAEDTDYLAAFDEALRRVYSTCTDGNVFP